MLPHVKLERQVCSLNYMVDVNQLELSLGFPKKDDNCTSSYFERRATAVAGPMFHAAEQKATFPVFMVVLHVDPDLVFHPTH